MKKLQDKVGIITGAARGIGRATALKFAQEGSHVALSDMNLAGVEETAALCRAHGVKAIAMRTDVTSTSDVQAMVDQCVAELGGVDALFNNAGVFYNAGPTGIADMSDDEWDRMIAICLTSVFKVSRAVLAHWVKSGTAGAIVNSASISRRRLHLRARRTTARRRPAWRRSRAVRRSSTARSVCAATASRRASFRPT